MKSIVGETPVKRPPRAPFVTRDNEYLWEGVAAGELRVQRCDECGKLRHPPRPMCPQCNSLEWTPRALSGTGTVYSYVVYHHPQMEGFDTPYVVAVVDLEEGVRYLSNVIGIEPGDVSIGMPVTAVFESVGDGVVLPLFRPAAS
jgi:uncharacterized OB-fold protein